MRSQGTPDRPRARNDVARAVLARDAALERISRTRRWIVVASVALSGALAGLASALLPGKSFAASKRESRSGTGSQSASSNARASRSRTASASTSLPTMPAPAGPAQLGLSGAAQSLPPVQSSPPPAAAPAPAPSGGGGAVVSGGS